jgi:hypothetical protein
MEQVKFIAIQNPLVTIYPYLLTSTNNLSKSMNSWPIWIYFIWLCSLCQGQVSQFYKISKEKWESEYSKGQWNYLDKEAVERSRTAIVAVFAQYKRGDGIILDVGCGEGVLYDYLPTSMQSNYTGIDISAKVS